MFLRKCFLLYLAPAPTTLFQTRAPRLRQNRCPSETHERAWVRAIRDDKSVVQCCACFCTVAPAKSPQSYRIPSTRRFLLPRFSPRVHLVVLFIRKRVAITMPPRYRRCNFAYNSAGTASDECFFFTRTCPLVARSSAWSSPQSPKFSFPLASEPQSHNEPRLRNRADALLHTIPQVQATPRKYLRTHRLVNDLVAGTRSSIFYKSCSLRFVPFSSGPIQFDHRDAVMASILAFLSRSLVLSFCEECTKVDFPAILLPLAKAVTWLIPSRE